ncbi:MAG TPA: patatin-like phospholipase family protein [Steroidobacteraceae bacterium]|nr:patatin-like phospholipase family protein [Steroidobacteraceae bacterium]
MRGAGNSLLVVLVLAVGAVRAAPAQQPMAAGDAGSPAGRPRPRIGLVLSGGGARGAAHVGVLRVLEELHIPIDAIAGTSMGAVVGGLYAGGMSAEDIAKVFDSVDWSDAFSDRPARVGLDYRRRLEDRDFLVHLPLGFRDGRFVLPDGLIQGQKLTQLLRRNTLQVVGVEDFDRLPTPFRAVATDLETGEPVVMKDGDLATALHASLAAPGVFAPVERDGRLLVDGGIANNLPVDVARAMGVDRLIVVDVGVPLGQRDRLGSVTNVANQMLTILIRRQADRQAASLGDGDVLVSPDMPHTSSYSFTDLAHIVQAGTRAAEAMRTQLASLAVSPEEYARYVAARRRAPYVPRIRAVVAQPGSQASAAATQELFGDLAGQPFDEQRLQARIDRDYGQGHLELLDYQLRPVAGNPGLADLALQARENAWGPNYIRVGLRLQDDFEGNSTFDAAARLLLTDINRYGAEWIWDGQVGANPQLGSQIYMPFGLDNPWFLEPAVLWQARDIAQFNGDDLIGELRVRSIRYGGALGRELGNSGELRVGGEREIGKSWQRFGGDEAPLDFQHNEVYARYSLDTLDSAAFPRHGVSTMLEYRVQLADRLAERVSDAVNVDYRVAHSWGKNTAIAWLSGGALLDPQFVDERSWYLLGGFLNLSGMPADRLTGPNYGMARFIYYRRVGNGGEGFLNVPMYAGMSLEAGNVWSRRADMGFSSAHKDGSLFFGMDTFLGPAWLAVGSDDRGHHAFYLSLGRGF